LVNKGHMMYRKKRVAVSTVVVILVGYATELFCFCCVAWQSYMCFDKYISQPIATTVSFIPNNGRYPAAVTFCKSILFTNITANMSLDSEPLEDLLRIEIEIEDQQIWNKLFDNGIFYESFNLPRRHFTTFSWSDNTFKFCISFPLGNEVMKINQMKITYRWNDRVNYDQPKYNLQVFVHGWGSFASKKSEVPLKDKFQEFQLIQETVESLSTDNLKCSKYEKTFLDQCLEATAVQFANITVGCISEVLRYRTLL
jgi:hypothetical protein